MIQPRSYIVALALISVAACARSAQHAPAPQSPSVRVTRPTASPAPSAAATAINPVGIYDFSTNAEGMEVTGTITIETREGGLGGSIATSATSPAAISSVATRDSTITVVAGGPEGQVTMEFTVSGETISGGWTFNGMQGVLAGRKRPN